MTWSKKWRICLSNFQECSGKHSKKCKRESSYNNGIMKAILSLLERWRTCPSSIAIDPSLIHHVFLLFLPVYSMMPPNYQTIKLFVCFNIQWYHKIIPNNQYMIIVTFPFLYIANCPTLRCIPPPIAQIEHRPYRSFRIWKTSSLLSSEVKLFSTIYLNYA